MLDLGTLRPYPREDLAGDVRTWPEVELPLLGRTADVWVWLPPGALEGSERYPVVYLHDGDNLFDPERSFEGTTWAADRAFATLARDGVPAIAVGVPCSPDRRHVEYTPYPHASHGGGGGDTYVRFLADHLKPAVDAALPTRPRPADTVVAGSSLGGVISLHAWTTRPDVFGAAGCFSPAFFWSDEQLHRTADVLREQPPAGRVYLDVGGHEEPGDPEGERAYVTDAERLLGLLREAGVPVRYTYDSAAHHVEAAWAERLPSALRWLLHGYAVQPPHSTPR
jgi:predicted alpha/beta superfamily hydrolase